MPTATILTKDSRASAKHRTGNDPVGVEVDETKKLHPFARRYGPWAIVTGASSGIGEEFANQLGELGIHLVLVARSEPQLHALAAQLEREHGIHTRVVVADLSLAESVEQLDAATRDLEIGLLINNAGIESHGAFVKQDAGDAAKLVQLNAVTPMQLALRYGKRLSHRGKGGIVFVSSMMGQQGVPYFANYAASKAYTLVLGESLHHELKQQGVDVLVLSPGLTNTAMPKALSGDGVDFSKTPMTMMEVKPVVRNALVDLGHESNVVPGLVNGITSWFSRRILTRHQAAGFFGRMVRKAMPAHQL